MKIIAIKGADNIGKSTTAKIIALLLLKYTEHEIYLMFRNFSDQHIFDLIHSQDNYIIKSFSNEANKLYYNLTNINYRYLDREIKEKHRDDFIKLSESIKDIFGKNIFVNKTLNDKTINTEVMIIDDLRFKIEYDGILESKNDYLIIELIGKDNSNIKSHYELNLIPHDATLYNQGSIMELIENVRKLLIYHNVLK